jgi:type IV secretory pathway VirB10-like protein
MSLTHHRWLWLLATALATVLAVASLAATTALASEPDEDDEDDGETPAQILPATPLPVAPAPAAPAPAAPAQEAPAPNVRETQRTAPRHAVSPETRSGHARRTHGVSVRPVAHVTRTSRHRTSGVAVRTIPRGGVQAGAGGMAADSRANPLGLLAAGLLLLAAGGLGVRRRSSAR